MKVIGITGGIGSGKSTVMDILAKRHGVKLIIADSLGHKSMEKGCATYLRMIEEFGDDILSDTGEIDRRKLSGILFSDDIKLQAQNSIVHPYVRKEIEKQLDIWEKAGEKIAAVESAILVEAGCSDRCDEIWFVTAKTELRINRLTESRGYTEKTAREFISRQKSDEEYIKSCDRIIYNDGDIKNLYKQLEKSVEQLMCM